MKKLVLYCLFIGMIGVSSSPMPSTLSASVKKSTIIKPLTIDFIPEIISISELTQEIFSDFFTGKKPNLAIQCGEGKSLPCTISLMGDILTLNTEEISNTVKALKTFYIISTTDDGWLFSSNLKDWYRFYEFFTVKTQVGIDIQKETPQLKFGLDLELRD